MERTTRSGAGPRRQPANFIASSVASRAAGRGTVRAAIVSKVRLVRDTLKLSLANCDGINVLDAVGLDHDGLARLADITPDVVLVDLGRSDVFETSERLKSACPQAKLVAFALDELKDGVFACAAAGFASYVPPESGTDEVCDALIDVMSGRMRCAPHITAAMFNRLSDLLRDASSRAASPLLTARQNEIIALAGEGRSNKEIARQLQISSSTVKNHIHVILQKLQVVRRGEAVARMRHHRMD